MTYPGFSCQLLLLFLGPAFSLGAALHLVHCVPCTEEKLRLCPPLSASCPEISRQPGCSCCHSCALQLGEPCGIYTARCSRGLSCQVQVDQARPLYVLTQGQGSCLPTADRTETAGKKHNFLYLFLFILRILAEADDWQKKWPWLEWSSAKDEMLTYSSMIDIEKWSNHLVSLWGGFKNKHWEVETKNYVRKNSSELAIQYLALVQRL